MSLMTLILFFVYTWGLGFTTTSFIKNSENFLERNLMRIGIGLGVFVVLGVFLNLLRIPLDWKIFLVLCLICPLFTLFKKIKNKELKKPEFKFKLTKSNLNILIVLVIFFICLNMYAGGSFKYPYLEDDDPWAHVESVKYISIEKTAYDSPNFDFEYLDPYPPGYDILMGILHQTSPSMMWTLKFFNALIISLGVIFFYFFAKLFTSDRNKALFSTFVLATLPSFFTHFIWSHSLVIILFFPAMYCLEMIKHDKRWTYPSMIAVAAILMVQPSHAIKLTFMLSIYWIVKVVIERNFLKEVLIAGIGGLLISLLWWFNKAAPMFLRNVDEVLSSSKSKYNGLIESLGNSTGLFAKIKASFPYNSGTATRPYTFSDFFIAKPFGGINIHIGWGVVVSILLVLGVIYCIIKYKEIFKKETSWIVITLFWFIFTFLGTNSMTFNLPLGLFAFRFWLLLAIPVALLSSLGLTFLYTFSKGLGIPRILILFIIIIGVITTSGYQKYNHNTLPTWPPGAAWTSQEELQGYLWLKKLPTDTKVFAYSRNDQFIMGMDKYSCSWCEDVVKFRKNLLNEDTNQLHSFLKRNQYEYLVISGMSYKYLGKIFGENKTKESIDSLLKDIQNSTKFRIAHQTEGAIIFKVN